MHYCNANKCIGRRDNLIQNNEFNQKFYIYSNKCTNIIDDDRAKDILIIQDLSKRGTCDQGYKNEPFDHGTQGVELNFLLLRTSDPEQYKYNEHCYLCGTGGMLTTTDENKI